jgi:acyl-coenzyme A thioesterase PaaI-like protein
MSSDPSEGRAGVELSLQERYAPQNACFGCGAQNPKGLRLKSHVTADGVVATFQPEPHHEAFPGVLNGGIIGALLDCHSNWTAAHALMLARGEATPPCTVTAEFHVKLRHPTPTDVPVFLVARPVHVAGGAKRDRCTVDAELSCGGKVMATCHGIFVAVNEGHPAYHRW